MDGLKGWNWMVLKVDGHEKSGCFVQKSAFLSQNGRSLASQKIADGLRSQSWRSWAKVDSPSEFNLIFQMTESGRPLNQHNSLKGSKWIVYFLSVKPSTLSHLTINFDWWPSTLASMAVYDHPGPSIVMKMTVRVDSRSVTFGWTAQFPHARQLWPLRIVHIRPGSEIGPKMTAITGSKVNQALFPFFVVSLIQVYSRLNSDKPWGIFCYTKSISNFHFRRVDLIRLDHLRLISKQGQSLKIKSSL